MLSQVTIIKYASLLQITIIPENIIQCLQFKVIISVNNLNYYCKLYNYYYNHLILIHVYAQNNIYIITL